MNPFLARLEKPAVIAEIGAKYAVLEVLKEMVSAAQGAGADVVKFQTYRAETISTPGSFFTMEDGSKVSQFDFFKAHELSLEDHVELDAHCREVGIPWFSTPSHEQDVVLLERFDPIAYKTGSDDLTNLPFLRHLGETGRPLVVSTGMCTLEEVASAVRAIGETGNENIVLLHCVVSYPSRPEDANLKAIQTLTDSFGLPVGLSDHTPDGFTSVVATALGAVAIEKHFAMDHALGLPDAQAALDTDGLRDMVAGVRLAARAMGDGVKRILPTEEKWRQAGRKSLFSARAIPAGKQIEADDIAIRRPADGIHPHELERIVGRTAVRDIVANQLISWDMF